MNAYDVLHVHIKAKCQDRKRNSQLICYVQMMRSWYIQRMKITIEDKEKSLKIDIANLISAVTTGFDLC
jgi:hypothetical protein